jgi:antitoxin (DNA-binding transcriptional repressor) of toxin-antitoxin stability system
MTKDPRVYLAHTWSALRGSPAGYTKAMSTRVIHISDSEAATNFASLLERVRAGEEVVIERDARPVALLRAATTEPPPDQSMDRVFASIVREIPDEDWQQVPPDLSQNVDHYLYGTSKTSS